MPVDGFHLEINLLNVALSEPLIIMKSTKAVLARLGVI